ncbi:MAG: hypothetical protein U1F70_02955 [Candidatus Competibacteraceae bacterium]
MAFEKLVGRLSNVNQTVERVVEKNSTRLKYNWIFRIDGQQASLADTNADSSFEDGDEVVAVGKFIKNGSFEISIIRNETSGAVYERWAGASPFPLPIPIHYAIGMIITVGGILLTGWHGEQLSFKILLVAIGSFWIWMTHYRSIPEKMLQEHTD